MMVVQALLTALLASGGVLLFVGGLTMLARREDQIQSRLEQLRPRTLEEIELERPFYERVVKPLIARIATIVGRYTPQTTIEHIRRQLAIAGHPNGWQVADFLGIKGGVALLMGIGGFLFGSLFGSVFASLAGFVVGGALGFNLPSAWLGSKIAARQREIQLALPDALDLLTICVEAGLGFDGAMQRVASKWENALTLEFRRVLADIGLGKTRREALRDMAERCDVPDLTAFAAAIIQADTLGASISRILSLQSQQMRLKRRQRAEALAHQAPVKMLIPMAIFMLPAIYIVILGPMVPRLVQMMSGG